MAELRVQITRSAELTHGRQEKYNGIPMRYATTVCLVIVVFHPPLLGQIKTYLRMEIDPGSRVARLSDETTKTPAAVEYFQQFIQEFRGRVRSSVERVLPVGDKQPVIRAESFDLNSDGIVSGRRKFQELFSTSGTPLVFETLYQYRELGYGGGAIGFEVRAMPSMRREPPKSIDELPAAARPLDAITVIRISQLRGIDVAAIATYNEKGELFSVVVDPLKSTDRLAPSAQTQTVDDVIQESLQHFRFPLRLSVGEFQTKPTPLYGRSDVVAPFTIVNLHYARNRWVQQYVFDPSISGSPDKLRILEFRYTPQDEDLRFFDKTLPWQPAADQRMYFPKN